LASHSGTSSGNKKRHADAKGQKGTKARTAKANSGSGSASDKQPLKSNKFKTLINSPVLRNVVAAGLASAAAALLYRKSDDSADRGQGAQPLRTPPVRGGSDRPALRATNGVRRKAKAATAAVSKVAEAIVDTGGGAKVVGRAKDAAKPRRVAAARDSGASQPAPQGIGAAEPKAEQRQRKIRSDAGIRRKPKKVEAQDKALGAVDLPALADTETSALALGSATAPAGEVLLSSSEEQVTEAPSVDVQLADDPTSTS